PRTPGPPAAGALPAKQWNQNADPRRRRPRNVTQEAARTRAVGAALGAGVKAPGEERESRAASPAEHTRILHRPGDHQAATGVVLPGRRPKVSPLALAPPPPAPAPAYSRWSSTAAAGEPACLPWPRAIG